MFGVTAKGVVEAPSSTGQNHAPIEKIINEAMGEDVKYLQGQEIPSGEIGRLMKKAYLLWEQHNSAKTSHDNPKTAIWYELLFKPLVQEGLRSENIQDLADLYLWIEACRFAFGFKAGGWPPKTMEEPMKTIQTKLKLLIEENHSIIIDLLEHLDHIASTNYLPGNPHYSIPDYAGVGMCCRLLCHLYYHQPSVSLNDLTALCKSKVRTLVAGLGTQSDHYFASLITNKAELLLKDASVEDKMAFMEAFRGLNWPLYFDGYQLKALCMDRTVTPDNIADWIAFPAREFTNSGNIKTI